MAKKLAQTQLYSAHQPAVALSIVLSYFSTRRLHTARKLLMELIPGLTANDVVDDFMMHRPNVAPGYTGSDELRKFINTFSAVHLN
jgi:hypothetical protein